METLSQNKNLKEREALQLELEDTRQHLYSRDEEVKVIPQQRILESDTSYGNFFECLLFKFQGLYHRILVTEKSSKQQLRLERHKVNAFKRKLDEAEQEIRRLQNIIRVSLSLNLCMYVCVYFLRHIYT